jgi:hypothetical protein
VGEREWTRGMAVMMFTCVIVATAVFASAMWVFFTLLGMPVGWRNGTGVAIALKSAFEFHKAYRDDGFPMPWDARFRDRK